MLFVLDKQENSKADCYNIFFSYFGESSPSYLNQPSPELFKILCLKGHYSIWFCFLKMEMNYRRWLILSTLLWEWIISGKKVFQKNFGYPLFDSWNRSWEKLTFLCLQKSNVMLYRVGRDGGGIRLFPTSMFTYRHSFCVSHLIYSFIVLLSSLNECGFILWHSISLILFIYLRY